MGRKQRKKLLYNNLQKNIQMLQETYDNCSDVVFRKFQIGNSIDAYIIYIEGLINVAEVDDSVLSALMQQETQNSDTLLTEQIPVSNVKQLKTFDECVNQLSSGNPILLVEKNNQAYSFSLNKSAHRAVEQPEAEQLVRGPREGFIEDLAVNTSLLRRKIRTPNLKMISMEIGTKTNTKVNLSYVEGVVDKQLLKEVKEKLDQITIDGVLDSHILEELIVDHPKSPFPQVLSTERPDTVAAHLLEGRVAILVDGTPFILVLPTTFFSLLQSGDDYYSGYMISTAIRWLRYLFIMMSLLLPSLYVAVTTYHQEMVPTSLLLKIMSSREEVPFPIFIEVFLMEISFEALREAGLRLPKQVGSAVSIVGALIIGESAVQAGIVSAPVVIIVALTGIASFTIPKYSMSSTIRLLRFPLIILASILGLLSVTLGVIIIIIHLNHLRSFGVPYLNPITPFQKDELKDTVVRAPWWKQDLRPKVRRRKNPRRQAKNQKPSPNN